MGAEDAGKKSANPYLGLGEEAFWARAVARRDMLDISELWQPKFKITQRTRIVTFGSCFAQHFAKALQRNGFRWLDAEPAPYGLSDESARRFSYGIFSCRTGNIYTCSLLLQWLKWALGVEAPPEEYWEKDGRYFDPFRPNIEPDGFASLEEMRASRECCIESFRRAVTEASVFVFTLGLTESWTNADGNYEYPMCPGTIAGEFDNGRHVFKNQDYGRVRKDLGKAIGMMRQHNPALRFMLTVSPVPLTATMSGKHVLVATSQSKAILRAVAGKIAETKRFVDYFPSFEIVSSVPYRGAFFKGNLRNVTEDGVDHVMSHFFRKLEVASEGGRPDDRKKGRPGKEGRRAKQDARDLDAQEDDDVVCEEELLEAFGAKR